MKNRPFKSPPMQEEHHYNKKEIVAEYIKSSKNVDGRALIEKLKQVLPAHSTLLEIGAGPGSDYKILNAFYTVIASDSSPEFLKHLMAENPKGNFIALDAITLATEKKFDGIYANKVMHLFKDHDFSKSIKRQYEVLKDKGIICHSFWKGQGNHTFDGMFVKYHDVDSIKKNYSKYFDIISIECYKEFEDNDSLLFIGKKK